MKKVVGLFLVILISSVSVFAQKDKRGERGGDPVQRCEKIITELKLDEKQAADFRKMDVEFREKIKAERDKANSDREAMREKMTTMRKDRDAEVKKILMDEQYQQYQQLFQKHRPEGNRKGQGRKG